MLNSDDIIQQFRDDMRGNGIVTDDAIVADGQLHRIHVEGDRKGVRNGWYKLHNDEHPVGVYGCNKRFGADHRFTWKCSGGSQAMTPEERQRIREMARKSQVARQQADDERHAAAATLATQLWNESSEADDNHPYLKRKGVKSHGLRVGEWKVTHPDTGQVSTVSKLALLVPVKESRDKLSSLQAIFPHDRNILKRDKAFLKNGVKSGRYFSIGNAPQDGVIIICEGYATGATIHEATGHLVVIAFDSGNLLPVAKKFKERSKSARIVLAADNDEWTTTPVNNPGVTHAMEAADAVDGIIVIPEFLNTATKPTDFNDLHQLEGPDAVRRLFDRQLALIKVAELAGAPPEVITSEAPQPLKAAPKRALIGMTDIEKHGKFVILGYDHGTYYIFHHGKKQILDYTKGDFTDNGLIEIADLNFWEQEFPGGDKSINKKAAFNFIVNLAHARGIYDIGYIRGRGAWTDNGRSIYHHGEFVSVDGHMVGITDIESRYVYELNKPLPLPADEMLSDEDGLKILNIAKMFRWNQRASAVLLAGWVFLAPICGALKWRPHIWITGGAGTGKSWILNAYVKALLGDTAHFFQGNSTEPGMRQTLKADAMPVLFDEGEQNEEPDKRRVQNILSLVRQSSTDSEARTAKGTTGGDAMRFHIRSSFCLASVQVGIKHQADIERLTLLTLKPKVDSQVVRDDWKKLESLVDSFIRRNSDLSARLLRRSIDMLPVSQQNIKTFADAAATKFGTQREGDQYGTMLAGMWSLTSRTPATAEDAARVMATFDWSEHREKSDTDESAQALSALCEARVRAPNGGELSVLELIKAAKGLAIDGATIAKDVADRLLALYGMKVKDSWLLLSNNSNSLRHLMAGTAFDADLRGMLLRVPGADRNENKPLKFSGVPSKCIRVPIGPLLTDDNGSDWGHIEGETAQLPI